MDGLCFFFTKKTWYTCATGHLQQFLTKAGSILKRRQIREERFHICWSCIVDSPFCGAPQSDAHIPHFSILHSTLCTLWDNSCFDSPALPAQPNTVSKSFTVMMGNMWLYYFQKPRHSLFFCFRDQTRKKNRRMLDFEHFELLGTDSKLSWNSRPFKWILLIQIGWEIHILEGFELWP